MVERCKKFAAMRQIRDGSFYGKRGGFKTEDVLAGALGECAAYKLLRSQDIQVNKPNFEVQLKADKSFKADLSDGTCHYHVKSQTTESEALYGRSWILQRKDPLLVKELVNHYLILTVVDLATFKVSVIAVIDINAILDRGLIGECRLKWFQRDKVAIYSSDLEKNLTEEERCVMI